jgi:hypothetical protein
MESTGIYVDRVPIVNLTFIDLYLHQLKIQISGILIGSSTICVICACDLKVYAA